MDCVFCKIVTGLEPANFINRVYATTFIEPKNPVTPGHVLAIPHHHVEDFAESPSTTATVMGDVAEYAKQLGYPCNIITSKGAEATQTVFHMHVHIVPRREDDGLHLPWTGQHEV